MSFILRFTVLATLKYAVQYCWLWSPCCLLYPVTYLGLEICASWSPPWILPTHPQLAITNLLPISMWSWRRQWHPTPVLLPGKSHGRRSLVGCSPWGCWGRTQLSNFTFTFHFHALEKEMEMATHSSVLAWRIPGTGKPGGLPSMGLHRVGHDWSDLA